MNVIVITHGRASETTLRHIPNWINALEKGDKLTFISPTDDPFHYDNAIGKPRTNSEVLECLNLAMYYNAIAGIQVGISEHNGPDCIKRLNAAIELAAKTEGVTGIFEYDALVYNADKLTDDTWRLWMEVWAWFLVGGEFENKDTNFRAPKYFHFPYVAYQKDWKKLKLDLPCERFADRQFGLMFAELCDRYNSVKVTGYSQNSIDSPDKVEELMAYAKEHKDCFFTVHGVKTSGVFNELNQAVNG